MTEAAAGSTVDLPAKKQKPCVACGNDIPGGAKICPGCRTAQVGLTQCTTCKQWMPEDARRCNACSAYRGVPYIPFSQSILALLVALISVITPAITAVNYLRNYHSHTSFIVTKVDADGISLYVWNTGSKPSKLLRYVLLLGDAPIATLEPIPPDRAKTAIESQSRATIGLELSGLTPAASEIETSTQAPALWVEVEESNDAHRKFEVPLPKDPVLKLLQNN